MMHNLNDDNNDLIIDTTSALIDIDDRQGITFDFISPREKTFLYLASILTKANAPHYVYNEIIRWAQSLKENDLDRVILYDTLVERMAERYNLQNMFPSTDTLHLPSGNMVLVTKFSFTEQLYSMLTDQSLMNPENLIYGNDMFRRETEMSEDHVYGDINTGSWFIETQRTVCLEQMDVLVPIIIYIDKTFVKSKSSEPVSFTLGIFTR